MAIDVQKWLLENGFNDVVTNGILYSKNTPENAKKWVYVSDILKLFVEKECGGKCSIKDSNCTIPDVIHQVCEFCGSDKKVDVRPICQKCRISL